jgi:hypothetical protein
VLEAPACRARACLYGIASVGMLWALVLTVGIAATQGPAPRNWDREDAGATFAYNERVGSHHGLDSANDAPSVLDRKATDRFSQLAVASVGSMVANR